MHDRFVRHRFQISRDGIGVAAPRILDEIVEPEDLGYRGLELAPQIHVGAVIEVFARLQQA